MREIIFKPTFKAWREAARRELGLCTPPEEIVWTSNSDPEGLGLFTHAISTGAPEPRDAPPFKVPRAFLESASVAARHSSGAQWALLYRMVWLQHHGTPELLKNPAHPDAIQLRHLEHEVRRDAYRIVAYVRFRKVGNDQGECYFAWIEPEHDSLGLATDHFVKRYSNMNWSILTPRQCAHWNTHQLWFTEGVERSVAPGADELETLWVTYYSHIFNPARVNPRAMQAQMPKKTWKNLVEAKAIAPALAKAPSRVKRMLKADAQPDALTDFPPPPIPDTHDLQALRDAVPHCRACPLYARATCAVFGEGPPHASVMFVGEQPGNAEDQAGKPFVGPAGQMLNRALNDAGVDRETTYVTNAVKHFKWIQRGKLHMHSTPNKAEIAACRPWLEAEIRSVRPKLIVTLGGSAAYSVLGRSIKVLANRGQIVTRDPVPVLATIHPSMLLRLPAEADRAEAYEAFVRDLKQVSKALREIRG